MHVKFLRNWRGYRAEQVREIGAGEGEILILRKFATPVTAADDAPATVKRTRKKRVAKRARSNGTTDVVSGAD